MTKESPARAREALIEQLAAVEHERWAHWQKYLHGQCQRNTDGSLTIPSELVERWETQIATPYSDLGAEEKESDREQVQRYLPILDKFLGIGETES